MYAVIFKAEINTLDDDYFQAAKRMRDLAINEYNCVGFTSVTEGNEEIAISYWESLDDIKAWKQNTEHLKVQQLGQSKWYKSYQVEITEVIRKYHVK